MNTSTLFYSIFRNILIGIVLCSGMTVYAQSGKVLFAGRVVDEETREPVSYATVRLLSPRDSALVAGLATDGDGRFRISVARPKVQSLLLNITFVGYSPWYKEISFPKKTSLDVGTISLASDGFLLDETVIVGKAPMAVTEQDTTVFNASAYRTPEGSMLEDLVKQLPGGEISDDGKLMIHGKEVKKILVDGKEFFSDDPKVALKNLPVEMVEKLKAYERKSDLARLTGVDDGDEEMILDLSVKKGMKKGWMNNFMAGAGTKDRYELANTMNRFRDNSQLTIIGNLNNTNNQGFSELQQESSAASGNNRNKSGLTKSRSLGVNMSKDWGERIKFRTNVQYSGSNHTENSRVRTDNIQKKTKSITENTSNSHAQNDNLTANAFLEWKLDTVTTLIFRPQYSYATSDRASSGWQQGWEEDVLLNERTSSNSNDNSRYNLSLMLQLSRKLSRKGRNIALKVDYGLNNSEADRQNMSTTHYFKTDKEKLVNQKIDDGGDGYNYRLQLIYSEPLPWSHFLQFRYSYQYRVSNSDRFVYNWDKEADEFIADYDTLSSNCFENQYSTHLFNLGIRTNRKKYNYNIGMDFEPQKSVSRSFLDDKVRSEMEKNVFNLSPTLNFRYKHSKRTQLQVVYRGRSRQPSVRDLQPVADMTNPLNIRIGNPSLKPTYTNSFSLNYRTYNMKHQRNMVFILSAENVMNSVTNMVTYDDETGGRTTTPVNLNGNWNASGSFAINTPFLSKNFLIRSNSMLRYRNQTGYTNLSKEDPVKSTVRHMTARERLFLTYRHRLFEITARGEVLYNNSYNDVRDRRTETYDYQMGGSAQCYLPWNFELNTNIVYSMRSGYGSGSKDQNYVMWNCQLSKAFLKRKQLLLRLKVYDILQQENSLVRTVSATAIRDAEYNVLGSYAMLHVIWRLNRMGKKH